MLTLSPVHKRSRLVLTNPLYFDNIGVSKKGSPMSKPERLEAIKRADEKVQAMQEELTLLREVYGESD